MVICAEEGAWVSKARRRGGETGTHEGAVEAGNDGDGWVLEVERFECDAHALGGGLHEGAMEGSAVESGISSAHAQPPNEPTHETGRSAALEAMPSSLSSSLARMMPSLLPASTSCADELKLATSTVPSLPFLLGRLSRIALMTLVTSSCE